MSGLTCMVAADACDGVSKGERIWGLGGLSVHFHMSLDLAGKHPLDEGTCAAHVAPHGGAAEFANVRPNSASNKGRK